MRHLRAAAAAVLAGCVLLGAGAPGAQAADRGPGPADSGELRVLLDRLTADGAVGAVAEVRRGAAVRRAGSGRTTLTGGRPVPADARFRAGSVTKTFTATVVLQLVGEGRLRLDDTVRSLAPGLLTAPGSERITVKELLDHSSGLPEYTDGLVRGDAPIDRFRTWTAAELVRRVAAEPLLFAPGEAHHYSNTDYVVLGELIERTTGDSYATEIDRRILRPLGLRDTRLPGSSPALPGPHAHAYEPAALPDGSVRPVDFTVVNLSIAAAAGDLVSTTADLDRFYAALLTGRLLTPALLRAMTDPSAGGWGLGLELADLPCGPIAGHGGGAAGYHTLSFHSLDGSRQVTLDWTAWGPGDPLPAARALLAWALCPGVDDESEVAPGR
ncbi:serine hydrolase domain-containing protein [Kitasatospora griseola]|uniref:serine hydrolase domain-containing protein n=1 Tax=Kitasatospora griseola TaxID=2064 RepID=UPI0036DA033E